MCTMHSPIEILAVYEQYRGSICMLAKKECRHQGRLTCLLQQVVWPRVNISRMGTGWMLANYQPAGQWDRLSTANSVPQVGTMIIFILTIGYFWHFLWIFTFRLFWWKLFHDIEILVCSLHTYGSARIMQHAHIHFVFVIYIFHLKKKLTYLMHELESDLNKS